MLLDNNLSMHQGFRVGIFGRGNAKLQHSHPCLVTHFDRKFRLEPPQDSPLPFCRHNSLSSVTLEFRSFLIIYTCPEGLWQSFSLAAPSLIFQGEQLDRYCLHHIWLCSTG